MPSQSGSTSAGGKPNGRAKHEDWDDDPKSQGGWDPEMDGGYSPSDFIIPGSDHQGHSERVYCRLQPQHARLMSKIMSSRKFPFRTQGDAMRWAIVRGLKVLDKMDPMPGFMGMADTINEVLRQEQYLQEFKQMFNTMAQVIQAHISSGAEGEARKLLTIVLGHIRNMQAEPFWQKRAEEEVRTRFGHLMEGGGKKTSLRVAKPEEDTQ